VKDAGPDRADALVLVESSRTYGADPARAPELQPKAKPPLRPSGSAVTGRPSSASRLPSLDALSATTTWTSGIAASDCTQARNRSRLLYDATGTSVARLPRCARAAVGTLA
jgi:hypothetical protein